MTEDWMEPEDVHEWRERCEMLETASRWLNAQNYSADGLISWRNYVAVALRSVDPDCVGEGLVRVIPEMETSTTARIIECYDHDPMAFRSFGFSEWLPHWQAHFGHWDDPVRRMLGDLCVTTEAKFFAERLHCVDGQILLDFLLCTCCSSLQFLLDPDLHELAIVPDFPLSLEASSDERLIEQLCRELYHRFREVVPFPTAPEPVKIDLGLNFDRMCPKIINDPAQQSTNEGAPQ